MSDRKDYRYSPRINSFSSSLKRSIVAVIILLFTALSACNTSPKVLKIGLIAPFEGGQREIGYDSIYAARLAVRQANRSDLFVAQHVRLALVTLDDGGSPELAMAGAKTLLRDPAVIAVIGHGVSATNMAAEPIYNEAEIRWVRLGEGAYAPYPPTLLNSAYRKAYQDVTPFEEEAGPFAGPTADAMASIIEQIEAIILENGEVTRQSLWVKEPDSR